MTGPAMCCAAVHPPDERLPFTYQQLCSDTCMLQRASGLEVILLNYVIALLIDEACFLIETRLNVVGAGVSDRT